MKPPELVRVFKGHTAPVSAAFFHPCMHQLVSGSHDGRLYVWHFKQQLRPFKFEGHKADVNDVSVAKDGSFFASASSDKTVALWLNNAKGSTQEYDLRNMQLSLSAANTYGRLRLSHSAVILFSFLQK